MNTLNISAPRARVPAAMYTQVRAWLLEHDPDAQHILDWSGCEIAPPATPEAMAGEITWIILCAGRSAQAARTIERKVRQALASGQPVVDVFGHRGKAAAIERAWCERNHDYAELQAALATGSPQHLLGWCHALPYVGDDTQYQLAKNFGADVCKPDVWLSRLAGFADRPRRAVEVRFPACMALCGTLADSSGDRIAAVDSMLWLACNKGVLQVSADAGPVQLHLKKVTVSSIYGAATS